MAIKPDHRGWVFAMLICAYVARASGGGDTVV
jgi:hypothetical protein